MVALEAERWISAQTDTILRTKLARDRAVRAKFVEIRVRFNQGKV